MSDIFVVGARGIPDVEGGAEKNAEKLFPYFAEAGYEVQLAELSRYHRRKSFRGIQLISLPTVDVLKTDKLFYNLAALVYAVVRRPRIVHLQCLNSAIFLIFYKLAGLRVVMRYGSSDYEFAKWGFIERQVLRLCEYQVRFADHVITVSEKFREALTERHGLKHVSVIPNGLDTPCVTAASEEFFRRLGLKGKRFILSVGRVTADKSFETLVEAVKNLNDPTVHLVVAGGPEANYSEKFFDDPDERIHFLGRVERGLLPSLYENCAVYVNSSRHEGLSNAILEALSYGCPLIVSDIAANQEMAFPKHNYFPVGDDRALARQIGDALDRSVDYVCLVKGFSDWDDVFHRTNSVYAEVAPKHFQVGSNGSQVQARSSKEAVAVRG